MSEHLGCISSIFRYESAYVCRRIISFTHLIKIIIWLCTFVITQKRDEKAVTYGKIKRNLYKRVISSLESEVQI